MDASIDIGGIQYLSNYRLSANARYRARRYFGVDSPYSDGTALQKDYPELWETEYRLRYELGQLKLDSRLRYASYIYGTQSNNYSSEDYRGQLANNRRNTLNYRLEYAPTVGSLLRLEQSFNFPEQSIEFGKLSSFVSLFGDVPWLSFTATNIINPQKNDWGEVLLEARLQEGSFAATLKHRQDLQTAPLRSDPSIFLNETQSSINLRYQVNQQFSLSAKTAYNYQPIKPVADNQPRYWDALDFSVRFYEATTAAQFSYSHDLNEGIARFYNFNTQFELEEIRVSIDQMFRPHSSLKHSNSLRLTWSDVMGVEFSNFPFLSITQYFDDQVYDRTERIRIFDDLDYLNFEAEYKRSFDSRLERNNTVGNYKNSALSFKLASNRLYNQDESYWLRLRSNLDYSLADALQKDNYLANFSLGLSVAQTDSIALASKFSYTGIYDGEKVDQQLYQIEQLSATAKVSETAYLSASFNNFWKYSSNAVNPITWSPYPTFYMIYEPDGLDFYAFVESETGAIGIGLGFSDLLGFQLQDGRSLVLP